MLPKSIVKALGVEPALLLSCMAEAEKMFMDKDQDNEGWFYQTIKKIEELTTLTRYQQEKSIDILVEKGVLKKDVRGMPAKRYFQIDYETLTNLIVTESQTSMQKTNKLVCKPVATSKEHSNKENSSKEHIYSADAQEIYEYWNSQKGVVEHQGLTKKIANKIDSVVKAEGADTIYKCIDRLVQAVNSDYWYSHRWSLYRFLKQANGYKNWLDQGEYYVNYKLEMEKKTKQRRDKDGNYLDEYGNIDKSKGVRIPGVKYG